ncbi:hypothetical protein, partial [Rothia nasimurium]
MLKKYMFGILLCAAIAVVALLTLMMSFRGQLGDKVEPIVLDRTSSPTTSATPTSEATTAEPSDAPTT